MSERPRQPGGKFKLSQTLRLKMARYAVVESSVSAGSVSAVQLVPVLSSASFSHERHRTKSRKGESPCSNGRKSPHNSQQEWWFVITMWLPRFTDSVDASDYLKKLRRRDPSLSDAFQRGGQLVPPLASNSTRPVGARCCNAGNTEGVFRLIQSIPARRRSLSNAGWARVGYERVQEIENPEFGRQTHPRHLPGQGLFRTTGIEKRMRSIAIRDELTDEWKKRA